MKASRLLYLTLLTSGIFWSASAQDTIFFENFDSSPGEKPYGWTTEDDSGDKKWTFVDGGGTKTPHIIGSRQPSSAYSDTVNALYFFESLGGEEIFLITPPINLEYAVKPELQFMHAQVEDNFGFGASHSELRVYYKTHLDSLWTEARRIGEYTDEVADWTEQTILLPEGAYVSECYFAFKGKTAYGPGLCIDDVSIIETGVQQRYLDTIIINNAAYNYGPTGSDLNPILRLDFSVKGNTGDVILNSLDVSSLNTTDSDIPTNGVRLLYNNNNKNFYAGVALDTTSLISGVASFSSLNYSIPTGNSSFWVTYDIAEDAEHGNTLDAMLETGSISINSSTYPSSDNSPVGYTTIQEAVFLDDFSTDKGWSLAGDFERNRPKGLGGNYLGNPDPMYASGDTMIIGNDLSDDGDYEVDVPRYENLATSPVFDLYYYNDIRVNFLRWLNTANNDTATIEMSVDNGGSWSEIWTNNNSVFSNSAWFEDNISLPDAGRNSQVSIRFNLGGTSGTDNFSGWNIENFSITGNYVEYDVGPTALLSPGAGCGLTSDETVSIRVKNFGPDASPANIPVWYSFDGGSSFTKDTLSAAIPFEGETDFSFSEKFDLSTPGVYDVVIKTALESDEETTNNTFDTLLYVDPSYSLPYFQNFDGGTDFWRAEGENTTFEFGEPGGGVIHDPASEPNAWVTNLDGNYYNDEDGFLRGPCLDLSGVNYPVFECKIFINTEDDKDGANLEYSLNNGQTWLRVGNMGDGDAYNWNWYNSNAITSLTGGHGWTDGAGEWQTARILLDTNVFRDASSVKFRFHFASDATGNLEGIGIDDIHVYNAPRDIGVTSIEYPIDGCAQDIGNHVEVTVKNFGLDTLLAGDTLILGYDFDSEPTVIDTLVLETDVLKGGTLSYAFKKPLVVTTSGFKDIEAFSLLPDDVDFYNEGPTNDTSSKTIEVQLTPFVNLPSVIYSVRPDTIVLDAYTGEPGDTYLWQDTSTDSVFDELDFDDGVYSVIASNAFCDYRDTTYVYRLIADVGVTEVIDPVSDCELGAAVLPRIIVSNFGSDTLHIGDEVPVRYRIDSEAVVEETAVLSELVYPDGTFEYSFSTSSDMSMIKTYSVKAFTDLAYDDTITNDTLHSNVEVYGLTSIDLGADTVVRALEYTIDAGSGYDSYLWQDGSSDQTLLVDSTAYYKVTVVDGTKCENSDSVLVSIIIPDISIERLSNPGNECELSSTENMDIYVINAGTDTLITGDTILVEYQINAGSLMYDTLFVDSRVEPGDSILFSSSETVDLSGEGTYQFLVDVSHSMDLVPGNNNLDQSIENYGYPDISLGEDKVVNSKSHTLDAGAGFISYLWHDGSSDQQFEIIYDERTADSTYSVTVTDENSCAAYDEVKIAFDISDLAVRSILTPTSACYLSAQEELKVLVINVGTKIIVNEQIKIVAKVDASVPVTGQKTLTTALNPGDSLEFLFGHTFDFSAEGDHMVTVNSIYANDADSENDTLISTISHIGSPPIDLGGTNDSLATDLPHTLDAGADYVTYLWDGTPGSRTYNATDYGWYKLEVTDLQGCEGIDSVYLMISTGIADYQLPGDLKVYPVPTDDMLYIEYRSEKSEHLYLDIYDARGRKILVKEYQQASEILESIDVKAMNKGLYFLKLRSDKQQIIRQIIVQ